MKCFSMFLPCCSMFSIPNDRNAAAINSCTLPCLHCINCLHLWVVDDCPSDRSHLWLMEELAFYQDALLYI